MVQEEFINPLKHKVPTTLNNISGCEARPPFQGGKTTVRDPAILGSRAPMKPELRRGGLLSFAAPRRTMCARNLLSIFAHMQRTHVCGALRNRDANFGIQANGAAAQGIEYPWALCELAIGWEVQRRREILFNGAGNGIRTRDLNLGKVALYQLSYSRSFQIKRTTA